MLIDFGYDLKEVLVEQDQVAIIYMNEKEEKEKSSTDTF